MAKFRARPHIKSRIEVLRKLRRMPAGKDRPLLAGRPWDALSWLQGAAHCFFSGTTCSRKVGLNPQERELLGRVSYVHAWVEKKKEQRRKNRLDRDPRRERVKTQHLMWNRFAGLVLAAKGTWRTPLGKAWQTKRLRILHVSGRHSGDVRVVDVLRSSGLAHSLHYVNSYGDAADKVYKEGVAASLRTSLDEALQSSELPSRGAWHGACLDLPSFGDAALARQLSLVVDKLRVGAPLMLQLSSDGGKRSWIQRLLFLEKKILDMFPLRPLSNHKSRNYHHCSFSDDCYVTYARI